MVVLGLGDDVGDDGDDGVVIVNLQSLRMLTRVSNNSSKIIDPPIDTVPRTTKPPHGKHSDNLGGKPPAKT